MVKAFAVCVFGVLVHLPWLVTASEKNLQRGLAVVDEALKFELINSRTDQKISDLRDGDIIDLSALGLDRPRFNVEAVVSPNSTDVVGSIKFDLDDMVGYRTENTAPYFLCGMTLSGSPKFCRDLKVGQHTVTATPYSKRRGRGEEGQPSTVTFEIVESNCGIPQVCKAAISHST